MNETAAATGRRVPRINHTPELEAAAIAVTNAKGPDGRAVNLCHNVLDVHRVRYALQSTLKWFEDADFYFEGQQEGSELAAAENVILLATLLREHLRAGNLK